MGLVYHHQAYTSMFSQKCISESKRSPKPYGSGKANPVRKRGARERADDVLLFHRNKRTSEQSGLCSDVVPVVGLEPTRYRYQRILSPSRLPIPSHRHLTISHYTGWESKIQEKLFASGIMPWHPIKNEQSVKNVEKRKKDYPRPGKRAIMYPLNYAYRRKGARE